MNKERIWEINLIVIDINTTYYILGPDDTEQDVIDSSSNVLGETSFQTFHTQEGFSILMNLINSGSDKLSTISIKTSNNDTLSITEFLDSIQDLIIKWVLYTLYSLTLLALLCSS